MAKKKKAHTQNLARRGGNAPAAPAAPHAAKQPSVNPACPGSQKKGQCNPNCYPCDL